MGANRDKIILGVVAVLVAIVLITPVATTTGGATRTQGCPTGSSAYTVGDTKTISGPTPTAAEISAGALVNGSYAGKDICVKTGQSTTSVDGDDFVRATQRAGSLRYDFPAAVSIANLIPLVYVALLLGIPGYLIMRKIRGSGAM